MSHFLMQRSREVCKAFGVPPLISLMLKVRTVFPENVMGGVLKEKSLACFKRPSHTPLPSALYHVESKDKGP